ncbi:hypothetical protein [Nitrobacter vulgaris]|uniref:hypothetical protein n=1 Tax=Nitrobacter vulgaris TaxID=29421 RepID=UPI001301D637|nr:hypothetical protein [Nitrobacter vulgaris]
MQIDKLSALVLAGALILWFPGYRWTDKGAIWTMTALIIVAGAYLVMWEKQRWRK